MEARQEYGNAAESNPVSRLWPVPSAFISQIWALSGAPTRKAIW